MTTYRKEFIIAMREMAVDYLERNAQDIDLAISEARADFAEICKKGEYSREQFEWLEKTIVLIGSFEYDHITNDSMSPFIEINDEVVINKRADISEGDIVCVQLQGERIVRRIYYVGDQIELRAENPKIAPMFVNPKDVKMIGKIDSVAKVVKSDE